VGDRVELPDRPSATRGVVAPELLRQGLKFFAAPKGSRARAAGRTSSCCSSRWSASPQ